jgi:hypothetical protein
LQIRCSHLYSKCSPLMPLNVIVSFILWQNHTRAPCAAVPAAASAIAAPAAAGHEQQQFRRRRPRLHLVHAPGIWSSP